MPLSHLSKFVTPRLKKKVVPRNFLFILNNNQNLNIHQHTMSDNHDNEEQVVDPYDVPDPVHREAQHLMQNDLSGELESRGLKPTGFWSDDARRLQIEFDKDYEVEMEQMQEKRAEAAVRRAAAEEEMMRQLALERELREEEEAVASDPKCYFWMELIKSNKTPNDASLVLDDITCRAMSKVIAISTSLITLDLSRNDLSDTAGNHLAKILHSNTSIIKLDLGGNRLGPKSAIALGDGLMVNTTMTSLNLEGNPLTGEFAQEHGEVSVRGHADYSGVQSLAKSLASNSTLTYLNMWRTGLGHAGGDALAKSMVSNQTLVMLDIGCNNVGVMDLEGIMDCLDNNKRLMEVAENNSRENRIRQRNEDRIRAAASDASQKKKEMEDWYEQQRLDRIAARLQALEDERQAKEDAEQAAIEEKKKLEEEEARANAGKKKKKKGGKKVRARSVVLCLLISTFSVVALVTFLLSKNPASLT